MWRLRESLSYIEWVINHSFNSWYDYNLALGRQEATLDLKTFDRLEYSNEALLDALKVLIEYRRVCEVISVDGIPTLDIE